MKQRISLSLLILPCILGCASNERIAARIVDNLQANAELRESYLDPDVITVVLVGTAGPMSPTIAQATTAVFVNDQFLLFDAGDYAQKRMEQFGLPVDLLDSVFMTHFHNDHLADLGEVMQRSWMLGREQDLTVYGPTGIKTIVDGFNAVYSEDDHYRTEHHTEEWMPPQFHLAKAEEFDADEDVVEVVSRDGVTVTAFRVSHPPVEPAFGYTIEFEGRRIVISGDTVITEELRNQSRDADLLVIDTMNYELVELMEDTLRENGDERNATIMYDIREYHPDVHDIGELAESENVKRVALTHIVPSFPSERMMNRFYRNPVEERYSGELFVGEDGKTIRIPLPEGQP